MAERHDLNIIINKNGEIEIKVEGIKGSKCIQLTEELEKQLGDLISQEKTSDYYKDDTQTGTNIKI